MSTDIIYSIRLVSVAEEESHAAHNHATHNVLNLKKIKTFTNVWQLI
jgi:hypothetical protein